MRRCLIVVLSFVSLLVAEHVAAQDILVYDSLDEAIESEIEGIDFSDLSGLNDFTISGEAALCADELTAFVRCHNPSFDHAISVAYIEVGKRYGLRGDIAFCQAILETGWFRFEGGTAVKSEQHNYCGLGVVKRGVKGAKFATVTEGVTAHIQHLYAYTSCDGLPDGEAMVDPRFSAVKRGVATTWSDLNNRWAMNNVYGSKILKIFSDMIDFASKNNCPDHH